MAMIGNVVVGLIAPTGKFRKSMKKAGKSLKRFSQTAKVAAGRVAKLGAVAAAAALGGIALLTKSSMKAMDATAKLSDRLGMTTKELQGLRHAAEITGAGAAVMDKSLEKMQKGLGEAAAGIGEAKYALDAMGMSLDDLMGKSPAEQFNIIADKVKKMESAEKRAFVATKLFGRSGQALINTMRLGSDGLREMQIEAEKLGIAYNRVDAAKVEKANDALTRAGQAITGIGNAFAIGLSPYIEAAANKFTALAISGEGMGKRVVSSIRFVAEAIAKGADYLNLFISGFQAVKSGFQTLVGEIVDRIAIIKSVAYTLSGVFKEAFAAAFGVIGKGIASLEYQAKKVWNYWKTVTRQQTAIQENAQMNAARIARREMTAQFQVAGGGQADLAKGRELFQSGVSGEAGKDWHTMAKDSALAAVQSYRKFEAGETQGKVSDFFDSLNKEATIAAEKIAAGTTKTGADIVNKEVTTRKIEDRVSGGFSGAALEATGKVEKEQLKELKKQNKILEVVSNKIGTPQAYRVT